MSKLNGIDLITIQEYLDSYGRLLAWLPACNDLEVEQQTDRLKTIAHLVDTLEEEINERYERDSH